MRRHRSHSAVMILLIGCLVSLVWLGNAPTAWAQEPTPPPAGPRAEADARFTEAEQLFGAGELQQARERLTEALPLYREARDREGEGMVLYSLGLVHQTEGFQTNALEHFRQALALMRQVGNRPAEAQILEAMGQVYASLFVPEPAIEFTDQALAIWEALGDPAAQARVLLSQGQVYEGLGRPDEALASYTAAQAVAESVGDSELDASILYGMGAIYDQQGQYARALDVYQRALALDEARGDPIAAGTTLNNLGLVYDHLGFLDKALDSYQKALGRVADNHPPIMATILNNIGNMHMRIGAPIPEVLTFYELALDIAYQGEDVALAINILNNIGILALREGLHEQATKSHTRAYEAALELGDRAGQATSLSFLGAAYLQQGQLPQAAEALNSALGVQRQIGDQVGGAMTLTNIGELHERQGQLEQALAAYDEAIAIREALRAAATIEEFKATLSEQSVAIYQRAALLLMRLGREEEAFDLTERARARTLLDQLGNARLDVREGATGTLQRREQALRQEIQVLDARLREVRALPASRQDPTVLENLPRELANRQREYEELLTQLKLSSPEYASLITIAPLTLGEVQATLAPGITLLAYFVTSETTLVFIVRQDTFEARELPVGEQVLDEAVTAARGAVDVADLKAPALTRLHALLVAPVADLLGEGTRVGIIPYASLHTLPFAALSDGSQWFGERHTLFHLPSASVLPFIQEKRKESAGSLLAVAQSQAEGVAPLQYAATEAQTIAALYGSAPLIAEKALESAVRQVAGQHGILHIAAHGQLNQNNPLFSRLVLAPGEGEDGALEVHEVYGLDLQQTDLVVLSACKTQLGSLSAGDDVVGLNRAFIYAGAPTVIASLWNVDDEATATLMTAFYRHLKAGLGKAQALSAAQAETRARYPSPYYWAAFVLTGDPGGLAAATPPAPTEEAPTPGARLPLALGAALATGMGLAVGAGGLLWWRRQRQAAG